MTDNGPYSSNQKIDAIFTSQDFTVNGDLGKTSWRNAEWIKFDHDAYGGSRYPQAETAVAALWTEQSIYFAFRCSYSTLNIYEGEDTTKERWELWNRDVVEIFLNPQPHRLTHYYEFEVAPNNQWIDLEIDQSKSPFYDPNWDSGFKHATRVNVESHNWTCEMCIPVCSMGVRHLREGDTWRLNFFRFDGPGDDSQRRSMSWVAIPGGNTFHTPTRFGLIAFRSLGLRTLV
jgi:alpha-galactosidase